MYVESPLSTMPFHMTHRFSITFAFRCVRPRAPPGGPGRRGAAPHGAGRPRCSSPPPWSASCARAPPCPPRRTRNRRIRRRVHIIYYIYYVDIYMNVHVYVIICIYMYKCMCVGCKALWPSCCANCCGLRPKWFSDGSTEARSSAQQASLWPRRAQ